MRVHNATAELVALWGCIRADASTAKAVFEIVPNSDYFGDMQHRAIYRALLDMHDQRRYCQGTTARLVDRLRNNGDMSEGVQGIIDNLTKYTPGAAAGPVEAARIVVEWAKVREQFTTLHEAVQYVNDGEITDPAELSELLHGAMEKARDIASANFKGTCLADGFAELLEKLESPDIDANIRPRRILGITPKFDKMLGGMAGGELMTIAGRPGAGKSCFGLQSLWYLTGIETDDTYPTLYITTEMSEDICKAKLYGNITGLPYERFTPEWINDPSTDPAVKRATAATMRHFTKSLKDRNLHIDRLTSQADRRIAPMAAMIRHYAREFGVKCVALDYINAIEKTSGDFRNRHGVVAKIVGTLLELAGELNIAILALAHTNRGAEQRITGGAMQSDLKESGALEEDSHKVIILSRPFKNMQVRKERGKSHKEPVVDAEGNFCGERTVYEGDREVTVTENERNKIELAIVKNRSGEETLADSPIKLYFDGAIPRFSEWDDIHNVRGNYYGATKLPSRKPLTGQQKQLHEVRDDPNAPF